ncbi:MAG: ribulokinase [Capsulimonadales bacterium]|nr:ribulokinase [Capsulimonadales bacterium]
MSSDAPAYVIGLDYGTNTVRALVVRTTDGAEVGTFVYAYPHGEAGVLYDPRDPELARQHPRDYLTGAETAIRRAIEEARLNDAAFSPEKVAGIGVDTTGSTPLPVDAHGRALGEHPEFADNPHALAWLWKDHTSVEKAVALTAAAREKHPEYLAKCGGTYSSEWFWAKMWHCAEVAPEVARAAAGWIEIADWIPAILTGTEARPWRGLCTAGHKGMYHAAWGGWPDRDFLAELHPDLARWRDHLDLSPEPVPVDHAAGTLTPEWAGRTGLPYGIPVAVGALDAHLGAVGCGIGPGALVKIMGTSTCDIMIAPLTQNLPDIPGLCGIAPEAVIPDYFSMEAGQSAVGDLFNWWVAQFGGHRTHEELTAGAAKLRPGESGLLALDWNNGNRTVLVDQRLTGLILGQTLATAPAEIYRALLEATAFGARAIVERWEEYGVTVEQVLCCGGIAEKNPVAMQIYADVLARPIRISASAQTCALGSACAAAVVGGVFPDFATAEKAMTHLKESVFRPETDAVAVYEELYALYRDLHDAFGVAEWQGSLYHVMKRLIEIRDRVRG